MSPHLILIFGLLIVAGTFLSKISTRIGLPVLLVFLGVGMLAGSDVLGLIVFSDYQAASDFANIALIFILFDSGFNTKKSNLKKYSGPSLTLATAGIIITALCLGVLIHFLLRLDWLLSLLIGSIISSTDAAAVMTIMREKPVKAHVSSTLEIESAANDPMAILLTVFMINLVQNTGNASAASYAGFTLNLLWQFGGGILTAFVLSRAAIWLFNHFGSENQSMFYVMYVGVVLTIYSSAAVIGANGTIAVFFAGYWMGNTDFVFRRGLSHFISGLSSFANMFVFLLLGLLVFPKSMIQVWHQGIILALALIFVARPLTVFLCTAPFRFTAKDRVFISWGGLKGAVPIILATYPAAYGLDPDGMIFNIVFFVVLFSCSLQGTTLSSLAKKLNLSVPPKTHSPYSLELFALDKTDFDVIDLEIHPESPWNGKRLKDLALPEDIVVSSMVRNGKIMSPRGNTMIQDKDILFLMGTPERIHEAASSGGAEIPSEKESDPELYGENPAAENTDSPEGGADGADSSTQTD